MEPYDIEDTSDWLGSPTELETCRQFLRMTENEVQELTLQLRKARQDIFGLVQMHAEVSAERDQLRAELSRARRGRSCQPQGEQHRDEIRLGADGAE